MLETVNGLTQVIAETTDGELTAFYTRGDELISMNRSGETSTYLFDGQGSVRMLADENGSVTDTYTYDAYGNLTEKTGTTQNEYMYCGDLHPHAQP